jgi:hypothetical protein
LPFVQKPKLNFQYKNEVPFQRDCPMNGNITGRFIRFSIENNGNRPALNCRCQILNIEADGNRFGDYHAFPLNWAARPENPERLSIARGETEFIDLGSCTE